MIGIIIAARGEWDATKEYFNIEDKEINNYIYGEYFFKEINNKNVILFWSGGRKVSSSGATQYMIDKFALTKIIVIGTCAGIDTKYKVLDIITPTTALQYDATVKEIEPFIKEKFVVKLDNSKYKLNLPNGIIGSADKAVVMWKDYLELKNNNMTIADTESGAIAYICKLNKIECIILKGISDFPNKNIVTDKENTYNFQFVTYIKNTPVVMNKIFDKYLNIVI